jgi:protein-S-isoprenylcysteine O-methyltransferase Ste14
MAWVGPFTSAVWVVFWLYWLISARSAKHGTRPGHARLPAIAIAIVIAVLARTVHLSAATVHDSALQALGVALVLLGLAFAVWARVVLGRNWGMPMTRKDEPELITTGPYRRVRHPIYTGLLLALLGTALTSNLFWLLALVVIAPYFFYSARTEERLLIAAFPEAYPRYMRGTKMFVPYLV